MNLEGKNIIITGASSGIGLELLKLLVRYDQIKIIAVARHIETIPQHEGIVFPFSADLSTKEGIDNVFEYAKTIFGQIDIYISNAGFAYMEKLSYPCWSHIQKIFELNTFAPIYSIQKIIERKSNTPQLFVCIISAVANVPLPYYSLYCSTKSAIDQFIKTYRYESQDNFKIISVYPIATQTPFFEKASNQDKPTLPYPTQTPIKVALSIINGIKKNKKEIYPSILFSIFKKLAQFFPLLFKVYSLSEKKKVDKYNKK